MEIFNVIITFIKDNELLDVNVKSFTEVEDAENHFKECLNLYYTKKVGLPMTEDDMDSYLDDGYYSNPFNGFEIRLSQSQLCGKEFINLYTNNQ